MNNRIWPIVVAAVSTIFFGGAFVATRMVIDQTDPFSLAFYRFFIASCCLLPPMLLVARVRIERRDILPILGLGTVQFGIYFCLFNAGMQYVSSARAAIIVATIPFLTLGLATWMRYESFTLPKFVGVILSIIGVGLALGDDSGLVSDAEYAWTGDILIFAGALCAAAYNVYSRPYLQKYPAFHVTALAIFGGTAFLLPIAAWQGVFESLPAFSAIGWGAVIFLGIPGGALGFFMWTWALERSTPTRIAVILPLNVISAMVLGALILSEEISAIFLLALVFVLFGIWLVNRAPRAAPVGKGIQ